VTTDIQPFGLSPREKQVLQGISRGISQKLIGKQIYITPNTVGEYVDRILAKMHAKDTLEAVTKAHLSNELP
jgi:DNA-binding NarL/FixJ family response regulator